MTGTQFQGYEVAPNVPKAGLVIVHGIAEHGGRYRHVAEALASEDIACFVYDQRGHGTNTGTRTHIEDFGLFADDLECIGQAAAKKFPGLPLFVWGHSMGSVVVMLAAIDGLKWARGVITTGCALDAMPKLDGLVGGALKIGTALLPRLRISLRIDATTLTQVPEVQQRHMSDPLVPRTASLKLLYGFALACRKCRARAPDITLPWLAVHGEADAVCPVSGSRTLIGEIASPDKQLVTYPGLLHEIHNEDDGSRAVFFELMTRWILARAKGYTVQRIL
ncbi:MAG: lysophospholipase [Pseudomonadota bacterium]|nr:lysophospholipase [Pseudomonadota bacterium]